MDKFWGDRSGAVVDPEGYAWMVGTHKAEPTLQEMKKKMTEQMGQQPGRCGNRGLSGHSLDDPLLARFGAKCLRSRYRGVFVRNIPD
jgi:hypothetical protein